ncbi:MAG: isoaspartyl peptidase/L-asparaginase [Myxococcales bacterium]|nr:isoaspartyl peptidase/L-asparaginase [Myxococcales bacterium]
MRWVLGIHGGAGLIARTHLTEAQERTAREGLEAALDAGSAVLDGGGTALDAVQAAIVVLEDHPTFNAGRGSVLNAAGDVEMDAALMDHDQRAGAVAACRTTRNPIRAARAVLEDGLHVLLAGPGADAFAAERGLAQVDPSAFLVDARREQLARLQSYGGYALDHDAPKGTVGAVALDVHGRLAAGNSTGGMANKRPGRVGDSPVPGAGTWCDARVAVAATGHGELFLRTGAAASLAARVRFGAVTVAEAADAVLAEVQALGGDGGLLALDASGTLVLPFVSGGMYRGWARPGERGTAIW